MFTKKRDDKAESKNPALTSKKEFEEYSEWNKSHKVVESPVKSKGKTPVAVVPKEAPKTKVAAAKA